MFADEDEKRESERVRKERAVESIGQGAERRVAMTKWQREDVEARARDLDERDRGPSGRACGVDLVSHLHSAFLLCGLDVMTHLKLPVGLLDSLPSLRPTLEHLRALLHSPYPPRSLFIHALSNNHLLPHVLSCTLPSVSYGDYDESPDVQDLLPDHVHVDCAETASLKAFFGTILNGLAGWTDDALVWNEELGGVLNWDGRLEGCRSAWDEGSGSWKARWDVDALEPIAASTKKGAMSEERKDESLSAFIDGLKCLFEIGASKYKRYILNFHGRY